MMSNIMESIANNDFFIPEKYADITGLTFESEMDAFTHFLSHVTNEKTSEQLASSTNFDVDFYLNKYRDVSSAKVNPFIHYIRHGCFEGRYFRAWSRDENEIISKARVHYRNSNFKKALEIIIDSTVLKTRHPEILLFLAEIYEALSLFEKQREIILESFKKYPRHLSTLISYGRLLLKDKCVCSYDYWLDFVTKYPRVEQGYLYYAESIRFHNKFNSDDYSKTISYYPQATRKKLIADAIQTLNESLVDNSSRVIKSVVFTDANIDLIRHCNESLTIATNPDYVNADLINFDVIFSPIENNFKLLDVLFKKYGKLNSVTINISDLHSISEREARNIIAKAIDISELVTISGIDFRTDIKSLVILRRITKSIDITSLEYQDDSVKIIKSKNSFPFSIFGDGLKNIVDSVWIDELKLLNKLKESIDSKTPFSFVRLGHGENRILGYSYSFSKEDADHTTQILFGEKLNHQSLEHLSYLLKQSFSNADVVGAPIFRGFDARSDLKIVDNSTYIHLRDFTCFEKTLLCDVNAHLKSFRTNLFGKMLSNAGHVNIIASRKVDDVISDSLGISTHQIFIPTEFAFSDNDIKRTPVKGKHYPDYFSKIMMEIKDRVELGAVYLVGAGILGKIYCNEIKKHGGIAIDVGSLIDGIAGLKTRTIPQEVEWLNFNSELR